MLFFSRVTYIVAFSVNILSQNKEPKTAETLLKQRSTAYKISIHYIIYNSI